MRGQGPSPFGDDERDLESTPDLVTIRAARPPEVTPTSGDVWRLRGWRTGVVAAKVRGLAAGLAVAVACLPFLTGYVADDVSRARDERARYVKATGVVHTGGVYGVLAVTSPVHGSVEVVLTDEETIRPEGRRLVFGERVTVLLDRDDPTDYRLDAACVPCAAGFAAGWVVVVAGLAGATAVLYRRWPLDDAAVRYVAVPVTGAPSLPPPPRPPTQRGRAVGVALAAGTVFGAGMPMLAYAVSADATWGPFVGWATAGGMLVSGGLAVVLREVRHRVALRRALATPPQDVALTAWTRVVVGRPVLVVAPAGAETVRDLVVVPLARGARVPASMTGTFAVHGDLRRGRAAVLRDPRGGALWPSGPVRGALAATVLGADPAAPQPPLRGHGTEWVYDYIDG